MGGGKITFRRLRQEGGSSNHSAGQQLMPQQPPPAPDVNAADWPQTERLVDVVLDEQLARARSPEVEHERAVAVYDLLQENRFSVPGHMPGPYRLTLSLMQQRLIFDIANTQGERLVMIGLALSPFRRVVRDYFRICESYYDAIRHAPIHRIEPLDMARKAVHDEAAHILMQRLEGKVRLDHATARRLFTLIAVLHWKGRAP